jgi:hypothetical protein
MMEVADWLEKNRPAEAGAALIHNDYKFDNIVLDVDDITKIIGVLDWEMATATGFRRMIPPRCRRLLLARPGWRGRLVDVN